MGAKIKTWQKWLLGAFVTTLIIGGGAAVNFKVRGLRNNNPGNIRVSRSDWKGKVPSDLNTDGAFEQFYNAEDGIRALARVLLTYYNRGTNTIRKMINVYAPPIENDSDSYVNSVSVSTGIDADRVYPADKVPELVRAIITHENGLNPYRDETITRAVQRAGWNA